MAIVNVGTDLAKNVFALHGVDEFGQVATSTGRAEDWNASENAVKTQVWCAVTHVFIAIVKNELQLDASPYTRLQILSASVFEKTELSCAVKTDGLQNQATRLR